MRRIIPALAITATLLLASCSSSASDGSKGTTTTTKPESPYAKGHECDHGATMDSVKTAPVAGTPSDLTMTSFDGTKIRLHWMPVKTASADKPAPTILMGPGWSLAGATDTAGGGLFSSLGIRDMWKAGYNVLTWDPRGFGKSEGKASINAADVEGKDVQTMLDFVAAQPQAQTDAKGDPHVGMVGMSYGGGIQLTVASIDCRVDAIIPGLSWHSLKTGLYKADTVKTGWANVLTATVKPDHLDPHIVSATESSLHGDGSLSNDDYQWLLSRGPGDAVKNIDIPTLFIQGTVDNLFTLDEATTNYGILRKNKVPTAMVWTCGGHGICLTKPGDPDHLRDVSYAWFDKYLKGTTSTIDADTNRLDLVDQDGKRWTAKDWPVAQGTPLEGTGSGTLLLKADGGSGNPDVGAGSSDMLAGVAGRITPARASNSVDTTIDPGDTNALALGAPKLDLTYTGQYTDTSGSTDGRIYAQLVDDQTGIVVDNQITPIKVTLDGKSHTTSTDLEIIAHHVTPGHTFTLQLVAASTAYGRPPAEGGITFASIKISIPTAQAKAVHQG